MDNRSWRQPPQLELSRASHLHTTDFNASEEYAFATHLEYQTVVNGPHLAHGIYSTPS